MSEPLKSKVNKSEWCIQTKKTTKAEVKLILGVKINEWMNEWMTKGRINQNEKIIKRKINEPERMNEKG